ncbi:MAG: tetratricopeptide repeat protein, partial [Deltaproteobacteria bacterium]
MKQKWRFLFKDLTHPMGISVSPCRSIVFSVIAFAVILFSLYGQALNSAWQFDDITNIVNNTGLHLKSLSAEGVKKALFSDPGRPGGLYRPVACITFALNHYLGGLEVFGYHLVNLLIHVLCSIFLFLFIYQTLQLLSEGKKEAHKAYAIALLSSLFWAVHPIQTQAVTYHVQRMTSLSGLFYIMGMYFYARTKTSEEEKKPIFWIVLVVIAFVLAFGSKENAIMMPVSLVLYEVLVVGRSKPRKKMFVAIVLLGTTILLGMLYVQWKKGGLLFFLLEYEGRPFSLGQRLLTEPRIILFYVSLLLYPVPGRFSVAHSIELSTSLFSPASTWIAILVLICAVVLLILTAKRHPLISFSFLFFLLNHVVESTVLPLELVFEHRNYVPSMLFFLPFAVWFYKILERYRAIKVMQAVLSGFLIFVLIGFGHSTYLRNLDWKNPRTLWTAALLKAPDQLRVHHNLGLYYQEQGRTDMALEEYKKALESPVIHRKNEPFITNYHLGTLYSELGDRQQAKL